MNLIKTCTKCGKEKPVEEFYRNKLAKDGQQFQCKDCLGKYHKKWYKKNKKRCHSGHRKNHLKVTYNLTLEQYDTLSENQNGVCAICGLPPSTKKWSLTVDHDHQTGKIRGLLCNLCNQGLGRFKDDTRLLERAIAYLQEEN